MRKISNTSNKPYSYQDEETEKIGSTKLVRFMIYMIKKMIKAKVANPISQWIL